MAGMDTSELVVNHIHIIGICGSGLSGIALVLLERGLTVSGSDRQPSSLLLKLREAGAHITIGHHPENVQGAQLVLRSSAIPDDNVEVQAAREMGVPVVKRNEFFSWLTHAPDTQVGSAPPQTIAVAGTHGKTTTTAMLSYVLVSLDLDPSYIIGGISANLAGNAHAGRGSLFVIEADEYDHMFLGLSPTIAIVTNIEHDHPDCYPTPESFYQAFVEFANRLIPDGVLIGCGDDPGASRLLSEMADKGKITRLNYGTNGPPLFLNYRASNLHLNAEGGFDFQVVSQQPDFANPLKVSLQVPGEHNVRNALAVVATAHHLHLPLEAVAKALQEYRGTDRRFEVRGESLEITVIDDYAHHPSEIRATLAAARSRYAGHTLWAVWQPHTYSRTRTLFDDFTRAFNDADHVLVTEIFPAREPAPADGFSAKQIVQAMTETGSHQDVHYMADLNQAQQYLLAQLGPGDVILVLSAGDANLLSQQLLAALADRLPAGRLPERSKGSM